MSDTSTTAGDQRFRNEARLCDPITRLQLAAERLLSMHKMGNFAQVADDLRLIRGAHARLVIAELIKLSLDTDSQEFRRIRENLTLDVFAEPSLRGRRARRVLDLASCALCDRAA